MATRQQIVTALLAGKTARQIMDELHLAPSKLRRALAGKFLCEALELERVLAGAKRDFRAVAMAPAAVEQLGELTSSGNGETARRACMTILETALGAGRPGGAASGAPGGGAGLGDADGEAMLSLLAAAGSSGQPRAATGSYGQPRAGQLT